MTDAAPVLVTGWIDWDPAQRAEALVHFAQVAKESRAEPDCLGYTVSPDAEDPARVHVFEHWASEAALRAHLTLPHVAAFRSAVAGLSRTGRDLALHEVTATRPMTT